MNSLGKRAFSPLSLAFCVAMLSGCASPPPPPPAAPPPVPQRTCETTEQTDVMGDARVTEEVTRQTKVTRCVTQ
jgi:hypothetical protein